MNRVHNFNPGPAVLPLSVLEKVRDEILDYQGKGMSILEMSHRGKVYEEIHNQCINLIKELLQVPDTHKILLLGGGATLQFGMIPMNFLWGDKSADYINSGAWAQKAIENAKKVGKVNIVWDGKDSNYTTLPSSNDIKVSTNAAYFHFTSNETIGGVQWQSWPQNINVPIVCDMSSDFMSRPVPVNQFDIIYAGAQKNIGPAGVTVVIIKESMLSKCPDKIINYLDYRLHVKENSLYNTPPVFAVWVTKLTLEWIKNLGGLKAIENQANEKAQMVYNVIDKYKGFYNCPVDPKCRSKMNVVFRLKSEELENKFLEEAKKHKLEGLKGHRSVGGCRASLYNALPMESVKALVEFMENFAKHNS